MFNNQKKSGLAASAELGQRIIDRAKWCEETGRELPFLIADIETLRCHVQLTYVGTFGDTMSFSLVDLYDPYGRGTHGYPKVFFGDTSAFFMDIVRELEYIYGLHDHNA